MASTARPHTAPRPRVVADAPVQALVTRADELARRWAIALILALPLERLGELPLESFTREAPVLCAQVARALSSDEQLERICDTSMRRAGAAPPALRLAEITGAHDSTAIVEAIEALRGVLWDAVVDEVGYSSSERSATRELADLADRLAYVCSSAAACSLAAPVPAQPARRPFARRAANGAAPAPQPEREKRGPELAPLRASQAAGGPSVVLADGVALFDEALPPTRSSWRADERSPVPGSGERATSAFSSASAPRHVVRPRPLPWDPPLRSQPVRPRDDRGA
jgi:hypothetical protein